MSIWIGIRQTVQLWGSEVKSRLLIILERLQNFIDQFFLQPRYQSAQRNLSWDLPITLFSQQPYALQILCARIFILFKLVLSIFFLREKVVDNVVHALREHYCKHTMILVLGIDHAKQENSKEIRKNQAEWRSIQQQVFTIHHDLHYFCAIDPGCVCLYQFPPGKGRKQERSV